MVDVFFEIGIIIIAATLLAYIAKMFKQPFIPAYILAGLLLGPIFGLITNSGTIALLSEIGIAFLLFIAGLELDFSRLNNVGLVSSLGGGLQVVFLFAIGYVVATALGFAHLQAAYIGLIISFSSTMVVIKLLSDKRELDTLHGRIAIGMLVMEDFIAIIALTILTTITNFSTNALFVSLFKGVALLGTAYFCSKYLFPRIFRRTAYSQELLFLVSLSVCFSFALLFHFVGFSIAIGAFIAGVTLANLPYNIEIISKVIPLKDFFATIFFVALGLQIILSEISGVIGLALGLTAIVMFIKPLLRMITCSVFGYKKRPAFFTSLTLAQTSEFSLIIIAQGIMLGHIQSSILTLTTIVAIFTITFTSYFMKYSETIYKKYKSVLSIFERLNLTNQHLEYMPGKRKKQDIVLCGYNRIGYSILKTLIKKKDKDKLLVVDFNPEVIRHLIKHNVPCIYGDSGDIEIIERINPKKIRILISTIPTITTNYLLLRKLREVNKKAFIIVTANQIDEALKLYDRGADYVILPHLLGGDHVAHIIQKFDKGAFNIKSRKNKIIHELEERRHLGHDHNLRMHKSH